MIILHSSEMFTDEVICSHYIWLTDFPPLSMTLSQKLKHKRPHATYRYTLNEITDLSGFEHC